MKPAICLASLGLLSMVGTAVAAPPSWVEGRDGRYSRDKYVVGVGKGPNRDSADLDARAEVARVFESNVSSVMADFQASASKVNSSGKGVSVEVQQVAQFTAVTAKKTLSGVELVQRAQDNGTFYALAVLDRKQCINSLKGQISALDGKIRSHVNRAEGADKLKRFKHYGKAIDLMDDRQGLNAMLRVCDRSGRGIKPPVSMEELVSNFDEASGDFKLGVIVEGSGAERVRDCIMEKLGDKGYQITEIRIEDDDDSDEDSDEEEDEEDDDVGGYDALLKGKLKSEKAGNVAGSVLVRTQLTLRLINAKTNKTLKTFRGSRKEGRRNIKASASLAAHKICIKNVPKIVKAIDTYFKR